MATKEKSSELRDALAQLPFISPAQIDHWVGLQATIDRSRDYLVRAVPEARHNFDEAQKILAQRTYTLVFFGGTGVGKSTLINALLGRNLLPTGAVTAVTGTIVYIEQADEGEAESLTLNFWSREEFADRVRRLCRSADIDPFDINEEAERAFAAESIQQILDDNSDLAKTDRDEYLEILLDCINTYNNHRELFKAGTPPPTEYTLDNEDGLLHLREDSFKGSSERQIRLVKSAVFRIQPPTNGPNLLMDGYLRIVDVPGLGAGMRLHEQITLEEMKKEDAMIVLVTDAGRQRVDEMKSLAAVHWIKENRLYGLRGADLDDAAAKIFLAVNGANVRQAFDRLNSGLPAAELELREVTRHFAPNYWEKYSTRGNNRPYFFVMPPISLYLDSAKGAPSEFKSITEGVLKDFADQMGPVDDDPFETETRNALLALSEVPLLRERLIDFIRNERVRTQLREAANRVHAGLEELRQYFENALAQRGIYPPFDFSWDALQERRYQNRLDGWNKELADLMDQFRVVLSQRYLNNAQFVALLSGTRRRVRESVKQGVEQALNGLVEDNRSTWISYNPVTGRYSVEWPESRILQEVELALHEQLAYHMPEIGRRMRREYEDILAELEVMSSLQRAAYGETYSYRLPTAPDRLFALEEAYAALLEAVGERFSDVVRQAAVYELARANRMIHLHADRDLDSGERPLQRVRLGLELDTAANADSSAVADAPAVEEEAEEEFTIRILDEPAGVAGDVPADDDVAISFVGDGAGSRSEYGTLDKMLDATSAAVVQKSGAVMGLFDRIVNDLFDDSDMMERFHRLFLLESSRVRRDMMRYLVTPLLEKHQEKINAHDEVLRAAMEPDLESISDVESLMRTWHGLTEIEANVPL